MFNESIMRNLTLDERAHYAALEYGNDCALVELAEAQICAHAEINDALEQFALLLDDDRALIRKAELDCIHEKFVSVMHWLDQGY